MTCPFWGGEGYSLSDCGWWESGVEPFGIFFPELFVCVLFRERGRSRRWTTATLLRETTPAVTTMLGRKAYRSI